MSRDERTPVAALLIRPDRSWDTFDIVPLLEPMQQAIGGGLLELTTVADASFYIDEEGKMKGQPLNPAARGFARRLGWRGADDDLFVGLALILGPVDRQGYDTAVTKSVLREWHSFRADHGIPDNHTSTGVTS